MRIGNFGNEASRIVEKAVKADVGTDRVGERQGNGPRNWADGRHRTKIQGILGSEEAVPTAQQRSERNRPWHQLMTKGKSSCTPTSFLRRDRLWRRPRGPGAGWALQKSCGFSMTLIARCRW